MLSFSICGDLTSFAQERQNRSKVMPPFWAGSDTPKCAALCLSSRIFPFGFLLDDILRGRCAAGVFYPLTQHDMTNRRPHLLTHEEQKLLVDGRSQKILCDACGRDDFFGVYCDGARILCASCYREKRQARSRVTEAQLALF